MIRFQTLGTLEVTLDGAEAPPELLWKKNVALRSEERRVGKEC